MVRSSVLSRVRTTYATVLLLGVSAAVLAPGAPAVAEPSAPPSESAAASDAARKGAHRVEVVGERTETATLWANPNGSFTLESSLMPIRVKRGKGWVATDPTLKRNADGSLSPTAAVAPMRFSGGGDTAFASMGADDKQIRLGWGKKLPTPEVHGSAAVYREVLPGVDLRVEAGVDGFTHMLVVKNRRAAANPALERVRMALSSSGLRTRKAAKGPGVIAAVDGRGEVRMQGTATMWDSRTRDGKRGEIEPRQAPVKVELGSGAMTIVPDLKLLRGRDTKFPVMIDPVWQITGVGLNHWSTVASHTSSAFYNQGLPSSSNSYAGEIKVGKSPEDGGFLVRTFFEFNTTKVKNKNVSKATFSIKQTWSSSHCGDSTARVTQLWGTNNTDQNTTWNTGWNKDRSGWLSAQGTSKSLKFFNSGKCPVGPADFDATGFVQKKARDGASVATLGLRAKDESDTKSWKRYDKNTAQLSITYNSYPNKPDQMAVDGKTCNNGSKLWVRTRTPLLKARVTDPDTGQPMTGRLYWSPSSAGVSSSRLVTRSDLGNPGIAQGNATASLADGDYYLQSRSNDQIDNSLWSAKCPFTVDATAPPKPTGVSATMYKDANPAGGLGQPDLFTFNPPSVRTDFDHFCYTVADTTDSTSCKKVSPDANGVGQATIYPAKQGVNTLRVWSVDKAGNLSKGTGGTDADFFQYEFGVGPGSLPAAHFKLDEGTGTSTADAYTAHPDTATITGATWVAGRGSAGKALSFNGTNQFAATAGPLTGRNTTDTGNTPVRTDQSLTVGAWVKLTTKTTNRTVVSQDGSKSSAFSLEYNLSCDCWRFSLNQTDVAAPAVTTAAGPAGAALNVWTHLQGAYDSANRTLALYVNGRLAKSVAVPVAMWNAGGGVAIGRAKLNGANTAFFAGQIDDVKVWNRLTAVSDAKAQFYPVAPIVTTASPDVTVGTAFTLTLSSGGDTNVKKFKYYTSIADVRTVNANANGTPVTVQVTLTDSDVAYVGAFAYYDDGTTAGAQSDAGRWDLRPHLATSVSGTVVDEATLKPVAGATVTLQPTGTVATTDSAGKYAFTGLTPGSYQISAVLGTNRCALFAGSDLELPEGPAGVDLALKPQGDAFGYTCTVAAATFIPGTTAVPMEDWQSPEIELPFTFNYYGRDLTAIRVDKAGAAQFNQPNEYNGGSLAGPNSIPDPHDVNAIVAPLWGYFEAEDYNDLIHTAVVGEAPNRKVVVEWRNLYRSLDDAHTTFSVEMIIGEDQSITFNYQNLPVDKLAASEAVVGIESPGGRNGVQFQDNQPVVANGQAITFRYPENPQPLGSWSLSGKVTDRNDAPYAFNEVRLEPMGVSYWTGRDGSFQYTDLETGDYHLRSNGDNEWRCGDMALGDVFLDTDAVVDLHQSRQVDGAGYRCKATRDRPFTRATTALALTGDNAYKSTALPFAFPFYGTNYSTAWVDTNGVLYFADPGASKPVSSSLPDPAGPNNLVAPLWSDLLVDASSSVRTATIGKAPNRQFVVEWRDVQLSWNPGERFSFEVLLGEHGGVSFTYTAAPDVSLGSSDATIGIENQGGTAGYQYSYQDTDVRSGDSVFFHPPGDEGWTLSGTVRKPDGTPSAGTTVKLGTEVGGPATVTQADGRYEFTGLESDDYDIYVSEESRCGDIASALNVHVEWSDTRDFTVARKKDKYGYACTVQKDTPFVRGTQQITMTDDYFQKLDLPFAFNLYGTDRTSVWYDPYGTVYGVLPSLRDPDDPDYWWFHTSTPIPTADQMNTLIVPFGRDFWLDGDASMWTSVLGEPGRRQFVIEWRNVRFTPSGPQLSVEVILNEDGSMLFNYDNITAALVNNGGGAAGVENPDGTDGLSISQYDDTLRDHEAILIRRS
ncbi:carboxypeptidase regulatory-like domain-containing protein [Nucisporomicrobium flavum]|uniref:carboxypeptidase regulatory-like domain-containing protein n=1 Tax=Nucisporomicrobium flavum TaxID=2785915 RepID=UPI0018F30837|nr:carboxypeptidase regulatory-like domain-containing protein [Nucisporomicrobium flavum]